MASFYIISEYSTPFGINKKIVSGRKKRTENGKTEKRL